MARRISTYSRVRRSGFPYPTPCQPSTTCGPETPRPRSMRPPESWSRVVAVMAVMAGVRAGGMMAGDVRERRHAPDDDRLGVAHRGPVGADEPETEPLGHGLPVRRDGVEVVVDGPRPQRRDLLQARPPADVPVDQLVA